MDIGQGAESSRTTNLLFYVNGNKVVEKYPDPSTSVLQYLRETLELTGTKNACNQGGCGACTVLVSSWDTAQRKIIHKTINSCITPVCSLHGCALTTIEGLGNRHEGIQPLQTSLVKHHGIQCGFCTPGMVMSAFHSSLTNDVTRPKIERALEGNLCRCTGYRPILEGFAAASQNCHGDGECSDNNDIEDIMQTKRQCKKVYAIDESTFPKELKCGPEIVTFVCDDVKWIRPITLQEVLNIKQDIPDAVIVMGATNFKMTSKKATYVCCTHVTEMNAVNQSEDAIEFGAAVTLSYMERIVQKTLQDMPKLENGSVGALSECLRWLACDQIKHTATLGGHVMSGDDHSDLLPVLMAVGATVKFVAKDGMKSVPVDSEFLTTVQESQVLLSVTIPITDKNTIVSFHKQPSRRGFDYAIVNACFALTLNDDRSTVDSMKMCFGGIGASIFMASKTSHLSAERCLNEETLSYISENLTSELQSRCDISAYKMKLASGFFTRFWRKTISGIEVKTQSSEHLGLDWSLPVESSQVYEAPPTDQPPYDAVGRPIPSVTAEGLVTGEAMFVGDFPRYKHELFLSLVTSSRPHARLISVNASDALAIPGVVDYIDAKSIPGVNTWGVLSPDDEELFASEEVVCNGQAIGAILAESKTIADTAVRCVKIEYEDLVPVFTIEDAIAHNSFYQRGIRPIQKGDPEKHFSDCDIVLEGQITSGFQEHFYMEPFTALVVPKKEFGEMEVFVTSHGLSSLQQSISRFLNIPATRITVRQKRIGGGFGGKEYRPNIIAGPTAVAANKSGRPVRCEFTRRYDMHITGKRSDFLTKYKVGFNKDGKIIAVNFKIFVNAGYSMDLSEQIGLFACFNIDGGYNIPHMLVDCQICKTNIPSNCSFRGFGAPEAVYVIESLITIVSEKTGIYPEKIREINMYKENDITHLGNTLVDCNISRCWTDCKTQSGFDLVKKQVEDFNKNSIWKKKGVALMPIKMQIGVSTKILNQGGALVQIYTDGSVLVAHGGVEMGQGLNTKMIQVASRALGVPVTKIYISETATNTVANAFSSAASQTSDIFGAAVLAACRKLNKRLGPYKSKNPEGSWEQWVNAAFFDRVSLSATGFGTPGDQDFDLSTNTGVPCNYYSFGAACSVVEVDTLTGDHQVLSADIVMDVGKSLNPAIDIGQIEGAFVQGYGLMTMEKCEFSTIDGSLVQNGPLNYKIPNIRNIPRNFRVSLLKESKNEKAVYSSKGIGEPPLIGSVSVFLALKAAITAARIQNGKNSDVQLDIPLTPDVICLKCTEE